MATFRAEDEVEKVSGEEAYEIEEEVASSENLEVGEPALVEASQPQPATIWSDEQASLNKEQQRFADKEIDLEPTVAGEAERQHLQGGSGSKAQAQFGGGLGGALGKKMAIGAGVFFLPTAVGLALFLIGIQAGFTLEHIKRISTGLRFGSLHLVLSKRFNHIRREYVRTAHYQTTTNNQIARYSKTTVGSRLLGVSPDKIYTSLNEKGYKFKYATFRDGSLTTLGRKTLVEVEYPDGSKKQIKNSADARAFLSDTRKVFDDPGTSRFKAMRSSFLLAKQIGIPFLRFKVVIDMFRDGTFKNLVRGSPAEFVNQRISEEILGVKQRIGNRMTRLKKNLKRFGVDELAESASKVDNVKRIGWANLTNFLQESLDGRQRAFAIASAGSVVVAVVTLACVIHELGTMIRDAPKMKIRGLQDNAATIETTTSQIRAGYSTGAVVSDLTQRFNGFTTSANYQVATNPQRAAPYIGRQGSDFSEDFNPQAAFDGVSVPAINKMSALVSPAELSAGFQNYIEEAAENSLGFFGKMFSSILSFVGGGLSLTASFLEAQFAKICDVALNSVVQIGILVVEIIATVLIALFSAGIGAGARIGAGQVVKQTTATVARHALAGAAAGVALDVLLFDILLPGLVKNASGLETVMALDPQNPAQGARNYASVDYGAHYLKEGEALNMGGSRLDRAEGLVQTQTFLALEKERYANRGLLNNLFNSDNPYSLASSLGLVEHQGLSWPQKIEHYSGQLLVNVRDGLDLSQAAYAQAPSQEQILDVMYPGQDRVIGFSEAEMEGTIEDLQHINNVLYVEENLNSLYSQYSECLALDASEFLLSDMGIAQSDAGREFYPNFCDDLEARRYKLYYQDCLLVDGLQRWGTNSSPMFSSQCDHLLPQNAQDTLREAGGGTTVQTSEDFPYSSPPAEFSGTEESQPASSHPLDHGDDTSGGGPLDVATVDPSGFDPGRIIDDEIFTRTNTMSVSDIQLFLETQVPGGICNRHKANSYSTNHRPPYTCLFEFQQNPATKEHNYGRFDANGSPARVAGGQSAAHIIWNAAQTHSINPQVLLVLLQKEQGLITSTWPWPEQYAKATGYACPDGRGCDPGHADFHAQVDKAAWQFRRYLDQTDSYWYIIGNNSVAYHPKASCGKQVVNIKNKATIALYLYTPYVPNQAALSNLYGRGDNCSSYGNRNFWTYFKRWFGPTTVGSSKSHSVETAEQDIYSIEALVKGRLSEEARVGEANDKKLFAENKTSVSKPQKDAHLPFMNFYLNQ